MVKPSRIFILLAVCVLAALGALVPTAPAAARRGPAAPVAAPPRDATTPLPVKIASVSQDGQELVWRLILDHPFSPGGLAHDHRSLCLLLEQVRDAAVTGEVCVVGGVGRGAGARIEYLPVTRARTGTARVITASLARTSNANLTATFLPSAVGVSYASLRWQVQNAVLSPACLPAGAAACSSLYPAKPALTPMHTPRLVGCTAAGPAFVGYGPSTRREVALTFDDGPWYDTSQFLRILEREHVPATFFEIGEQVATYGEGGAIERRMLADGDMIGDHTWSHPDVAAGGSFAATQLTETAAAIRQATGGFEPCLFRAPYGDVSPALISEARSLGFTTIQWNVDPRDWALPGTSAIYSNVVANVHPGSIVIQHDGGGDRSETLAALPLEIGALRREGYRFVTVTDLLGLQLVYK